MKALTQKACEDFQKIIWDFYAQNKRAMPWREPEAGGLYDPYKILVSELMLQQTQVSRVIPKYLSFLDRFSSAQALAQASRADVLTEWSGLGYNRRAKYLHEAAQRLAAIAEAWTLEGLVVCKGIGPNTAAAVLAYTYDLSVVFVETNIRSVIIKHFFAGQTGVSDKDILEIVQQTLPASNIRNWYYALMDYGSFIKNSEGNHSKRAKSYTKQSVFHGSRRQIRGQVLKLLGMGSCDLKELQLHIKDERLSSVLEELQQEALIHAQGSIYQLG